MSINSEKEISSFKKCLYDSLNFPAIKTPLSIILAIFIICSFIISSVTAMLETYSPIKNIYSDILSTMAIISGLVLFIEYILRILSSSLKIDNDDNATQERIMTLATGTAA